MWRCVTFALASKGIKPLVAVGRQRHGKIDVAARHESAKGVWGNLILQVSLDLRLPKADELPCTDTAFKRCLN
jgi:hypothetical protein